MRWIAATCLGLALSSAATGQMGQMGQMGMPGGGGGGFGGHGNHGGGAGGGGQEGEHPAAPRPPKPLKRDKFDKAVTAMFRIADVNHDGTVTPAELQAVIDGRRDALIRARFARIDRNRNGSIDYDEFAAWQRSMGSAASSEADATGGEAYVADNIRPELGDGADDRLLARLIEPLSATVLVNANVRYGPGVTLDELLAYEDKRFDSVDANHDGEITLEEVRAANGPGSERDLGGGGRPGERRLPPP